MELGFVIALLVTIPVILFPAAFVWYLNIGGMAQAVREARAARERKLGTVTATK